MVDRVRPAPAEEAPRARRCADAGFPSGSGHPAPRCPAPRRACWDASGLLASSRRTRRRSTSSGMEALSRSLASSHLLGVGRVPAPAPCRRPAWLVRGLLNRPRSTKGKSRRRKQAGAPPGRRSMLREPLPGTRRRSGEPRRAVGGASWAPVKEPRVDGSCNNVRRWTVFQIPSTPGPR